MNPKNTRPCKVFLNGVELRHVFAIDEEQGYAIVGQRNSKGALFIDDAGEVAREKRYGFIETEPLP